MYNIEPLICMIYVLVSIRPEVRMSRASVALFVRSGNLNLQVRIPDESNQYLENLIFSLPSQGIDIIRIGQRLVDSVSG